MPGSRAGLPIRRRRPALTFHPRPLPIRYTPTRDSWRGTVWRLAFLGAVVFLAVWSSYHP